MKTDINSKGEIERQNFKKSALIDGDIMVKGAS